MKVLNLHCGAGHTFEGWFANEDDFQSQHERGLLTCPVCNSGEVHKGLSAPRLNLKSPASEQQAVVPAPVVSTTQGAPRGLPPELVRAWMEISRKVVESTDDVGAQFAEEARKIHYGEAQERGIRGQASPDEVRDLLEEGIDVLPLALPEPAKHTLQ
ncbi:DUF1178 family protein [Curvibacter sp. APW13]|uniref:DUF1178 family protein n=1 Tax=Curvibacter sp. APW13 TaxID=3077236 RepID=UPI0028DE7991|nr:DUF1178 family protein [Curvibacter sp. APW13]MDT8991182.1 DUF1178 family protein [Curvibacter sp. APW13]